MQRIVAVEDKNSHNDSTHLMGPINFTTLMPGKSTLFEKFSGVPEESVPSRTQGMGCPKGEMLQHKRSTF